MTKTKYENKNYGTTHLAGFTLVEVIVVAVIVLILSAVAIPMYNGFIIKSRQDVVDNLAETGAAAASAIWRRTNTAPADTSVLKLHYDGGKHFVRIASPNVCADELPAYKGGANVREKCVNFR